MPGGRSLLLAGDSSLQLGAGGQLDAVASGDLDGLARLRVAAGACRAVGALNGEPARYGDLLARGDRSLENLEQCVEDGVDGCLAGAGLARYLCNKFTTVLSHLCPPGRS